MVPNMDLASCSNLAVPLEVMQHVVHVESSRNPFAIGVVGGHLVRQPKNLSEAVATASMLETRGFNFSVGIAQVNRYNLTKYGLDSYEKAFQVCPNLQAGTRILAECYGRSGKDWGRSFSCYYSGNFVTGYRHGYVQKIFASMRNAKNVQEAGTHGGEIAVIVNPSRRISRATPGSTDASSIHRSEFVPGTASGSEFASQAPVVLRSAAERAREPDPRLTDRTPESMDPTQRSVQGQTTDAAFVF